MIRNGPVCQAGFFCLVSRWLGQSCNYEFFACDQGAEISVSERQTEPPRVKFNPGRPKNGNDRLQRELDSLL